MSLLLWGVRMVHSGVVRAFGGTLRHWLARALRRRGTALLGGMAVTLLLQSSTATALMATSFIADGVIGLVPAMAVVLGANVGTALVACLLSFDITWFFPLLLFAGLVVFRPGGGRGPQPRPGVDRARAGPAGPASAGRDRDARRGDARGARADFGGHPGTAVALVLAALITWAMHSSIAAVLVIASLAQRAGDAGAALAMVLGANLGQRAQPAARRHRAAASVLRLPVGNLVNRMFG